MKSAHVITWLCVVGVNYDCCKANIHAGLTGFAGFTGFAAHVRVFSIYSRYSCINKSSSRARKYNPANHVNPVTSLINQGFRHIRVALEPCKTLIKWIAMSKKSLREDMPHVTVFIDSLRAAFGTEMIDKQIRRGMRGEPTFWASENGIEVGTRSNPEIPLESFGNDKTKGMGK